MTVGIEVRDLGVRFGEVAALDGLTFSLEGGKIYGVLGRNGAGKTTLLSVLAAFRKASEGFVAVGGEEVFENRRVARQVCLVRHSGDLGSRSESVGEVLGYAAAVRSTWDDKYAAELLDVFRLPLKKKIGELSLGQRSALGIVVGLASRAPVTMFDESHLGLDAPSRYAFYDALLADFMDRPRTILLSTHLVEELAAVFEEVLIIDSGRLLLHEQTEDLLSRGTSVTGAAGAVDRFVAGLTVLDSRELGPTKSAMVYGALDERRRERARAEGLELGPIALQDLFVHLTEPVGGAR